MAHAAIRVGGAKQNGAGAVAKQGIGGEVMFISIFEYISDAIKRMLLNLPDLMRASAMQMPNVLPEHTELISKAKALTAPSLCWTRAAVAGCMLSGDEVESIMPWS